MKRLFCTLGLTALLAVTFSGVLAPARKSPPQSDLASVTAHENFEHDDLTANTHERSSYTGALLATLPTYCRRTYRAAYKFKERRPWLNPARAALR